MFFGTGATSSVTHAAGSPAAGVRAEPKALVVLVKTKASTRAATACFEQRQRPRDVDVDEVLPGMGCDVGLVERRGVDDGAHPGHAVSREGTVGDRADVVGERRRLDVEAERVATLGAETAHQRFAEMPGAAGHEDGHVSFDSKRRFGNWGIYARHR